MKKLMVILAMVVSLTLVAVAGVGANSTPVIDGTISPGEWDAYYLGPSVTGWAGGMSVDVYGFADDTYLYVAYVADTSQPGWSTACALCVNSNFYYYTSKDTLFQMWAWGDPCQVMQTEDWISWDCVGTLDDVGVEYAYTDMYTACNNVAELKIPLSLLGTEGADQIELYGQYWQYDWAELFYVELLPSVIEVEIDIKPGSCPNCINLDSNGVIPVAILGSATFDAADVDPSTVTLEDAAVRLKGKSGNYGSLEDVNHDGYPDLVVHIMDFSVSSGATTATLTGGLFDGTPIEGSDSICIVP